MANSKASKLCKSVDKSSVQTAQAWNRAILDAKQMLADVERRVVELKRAVKVFEEMRDSGEPWPGSSESEIGDLGQDGDLRQSLTALRFWFIG